MLPLQSKVGKRVEKVSGHVYLSTVTHQDVDWIFTMKFAKSDYE